MRVVQNRIRNRIGQICRVNVVGSPGLVFMGRDSRSEGRGFESRHCILDGRFSHIFVVKIVMMFV